MRGQAMGRCGLSTIDWNLRRIETVPSRPSIEKAPRRNLHDQGAPPDNAAIPRSCSYFAAIFPASPFIPEVACNIKQLDAGS